MKRTNQPTTSSEANTTPLHYATQQHLSKHYSAYITPGIKDSSSLQLQEPMTMFRASLNPALGCSKPSTGRDRPLVGLISKSRLPISTPQKPPKPPGFFQGALEETGRVGSYQREKIGAALNQGAHAFDQVWASPFAPMASARSWRSALGKDKQPATLRGRKPNKNPRSRKEKPKKPFII